MSQPLRFLDRTTPPHLFTLVLIAALSASSMNVFLPSLPNMARYFGVDYGLMQLSVSLYLAVSAVLQLAVGPLSDRYGRRRMLLIGLALFVAATIGTLLAPNAETFLICRMAQSVVAVAMTLSRAIVRDMHDAAAAAAKISYITMFMTLAPMLMPIFGGALDQAFGWKASFIFLLVAGCAVFALVWADCGETSAPRPGGFRAQFASYPELLRSPKFWGYVSCMTFTSGSFFIFLGGAPFVASEIYGLDPLSMGYYFGATALGYGTGNFISGRFTQRIGLRRMVWFGTLFAFFGASFHLSITLLDLAPASVFFGAFILLGIGNGMILPGATSGSMSVLPHLAGTASGLGGAIMIGGGAALAALTGAVLSVETGAWPLVALIMASATLALLSTVLVLSQDDR